MELTRRKALQAAAAAACVAGGAGAGAGGAASAPAPQEDRCLREVSAGWVINHLAFLPDGKLLFSAVGEHSVFILEDHLFEAARLPMPTNDDAFPYRRHPVAFSP